MPEISWSCSTEVNDPCSSRQDRMLPAITGPTPGSDSSAAWSAWLRFTGVATVADPPGPCAVPLPPALLGPDVAPVTVRTVPPTVPDRLPARSPPTTTESPSDRRAARFIPVTSPSWVTPPAASMASATRDPGGNRTRPGLCTRPVTETYKVLGVEADVVEVAVVGAVPAAGDARAP